MKKQNPLVSVIVPCYNNERYLPDTLESIFSQTYKNLEVILIDDGSTDGTADIIRKQDGRARILFQKNAGAGPTREKGAQIAKGRYIQYVDADDILFQDAIEKRLEPLEANLGDISYSDFQWLEGSNEFGFKPTTIRNRRIEDSGSDIQLSLFSSWWCPPVGLTYSRAIVEKISWKKSLVDDTLYLFDACLSGARFIHVPGVRAHYRIHSEGFSRDKLSWYRDVFRRAVYIQSIWYQNNALSVKRRSELKACYREVADYSRGKDGQLFKDAFKQMFALKPPPLAVRILAKAIGYNNIDSLIKIRQRLFTARFIKSLK